MREVDYDECARCHHKWVVRDATGNICPTCGPVGELHQQLSSDCLPLDEQLAIFDRRSAAAFDEYIDLLHRNRALVLCMARQRLIDGYDAYGDAMFRWDLPRRRAEALEEGADGVNYLVPSGGVGP